MLSTAPDFSGIDSSAPQAVWHHENLGRGCGLGKVPEKIGRDAVSRWAVSTDLLRFVSDPRRRSSQVSHVLRNAEPLQNQSAVPFFSQMLKWYNLLGGGWDVRWCKEGVRGHAPHLQKQGTAKEEFVGGQMPWGAIWIVHMLACSNVSIVSR